jgi:hypothetical protein
MAFDTSQTIDRLLARDPYDIGRILPIDERQQELTARHIVPVLPHLEAEFLAVREVIDVELRRQFEEARAAGAALPDDYPKGCCLQITRRAYAEFLSRSAAAPSVAAAAVGAFRNAGGHISQVWGVLRNQYFQNALQFGSIYFDCANDTVVVTKPKVEYMPMADSGFKNIDSWEEFADVAERYWHCDIYPNRYFPLLAPLLPIVAVTRDGVLSLREGSYYMQRLNLESGLRASEVFLTSGAWSDRHLPGEWLDRIALYKQKRIAQTAATPREGLEPSALSRLCAQYRADAAYTSRAFLTRVYQSAGRLVIRRDEREFEGQATNA